MYGVKSTVVFEKSPEVVPLGETATSDTAGVETAFQTQVELFQSKTLVRRVLTKLNGSEWKIGSDVVRTPLEKELEFIASSLKVSPTKGTHLIEIQAEGHYPALASRFVNSVVSESIAQDHESQWKRSEADRVWLKDQVASLRQTIEGSEKSLFSYANASGLPITSDKDKGPDARLLRLQDELSKAQVDRFAAEARYEIAVKRSPESQPEDVETATLRDYKSKVTELRRQLAEASSLWTNNHYKVKQIEAQIAVFTSAVDSERDQVLSRSKSDYTAALRREQLLSAEYLSAVKTFTDQANRSIHYNLLKRDLDRDRVLYDGIVQKVKQLGIASGLQATSIHLVDLAEPPVRPRRPNVALTSFLAFICSTFLGIIAVLTRDNLASTLEQPGESALYLSVNELGTIPSQRSLHAENRADGRKRNGWPLLLDGRSHQQSDTQELTSVELATWNQIDSLTAQCFRATLASILWTSSSMRPTRRTSRWARATTIVVTSATVSEGKTTVVSNLGLALARMGRRVLLIDADYRKPRLDRVFGTPNTSGLRNILEAAGPIALESSVYETRIPGLYLLQSGPVKAEYPEILQSQRLSELMEVASREFDFVLVDTPPVLHLPDARIWGRLADGVVLVVRAGETHRKSALAAVRRLSMDGACLLGTILNHWNPRNSPFYEYSSPRRDTASVNR